MPDFTPVALALSRLAASALVLAPPAYAQSRVPLEQRVQSRMPKVLEMANQAAVEITGVIVAGGVKCPLLQLDDGRRYALSGAVPRILPIGTKLKARGFAERMSTCQQGQSFRVVEIVEQEP